MDSRNVYEKAVERIAGVFAEFDNVYVSFSGGKDSGVLLNLVLDYLRGEGRGRKAGVLHIDVEASYRATMDFVERMYLDNLGLVDPWWVCLPMATTNAVSMYEPLWSWWDASRRDKWVRPLPGHPFVVHEGRNPLDFYRPHMTFEEFIALFGDWYNGYRGARRTACLVGIRSDESLNRYRAVRREDKGMYRGLRWSTRVSEHCYNFYPVYDWTVEDIWVYNGRYGKPYNRIYDLFYRAGVPLSKMRVCEPYGDEQKAGLNLFRVLEPQTWVKVVDRVSGANFGNIYCGTRATGARRVTLPPGHTWKSYCRFLLDTLPTETRKIYTEKFVKFIRYWHRTGSPVEEADIRLLEELAPGLAVNTHTYSRRGKGDKQVVRFRGIADELPGLDNRSDFLSWKRLCMAILKNDITCRSLSFSITKRQILRQQQLLDAYSRLPAPETNDACPPGGEQTRTRQAGNKNHRENRTWMR
jgi:predicted phosphoadenosine phosphosulfate sulfurtransferase